MQDTQTSLRFVVCSKSTDCTNLTKIFFFVKKCRKAKTKLSTKKNEKNVLKPSFAQSYPHYPHKNAWKMWIFFVNKRTDVLWIYHKNVFLSKKNAKNIDF